MTNSIALQKRAGEYAMARREAGDSQGVELIYDLCSRLRAVEDRLASIRSALERDSC